jgi:hypothetical protein
MALSFDSEIPLTNDHHDEEGSGDEYGYINDAEILASQLNGMRIENVLAARRHDRLKRQITELVTLVHEQDTLIHHYENQAARDAARIAELEADLAKMRDSKVSLLTLNQRRVLGMI